MLLVIWLYRLGVSYPGEPKVVLCVQLPFFGVSPHGCGGESVLCCSQAGCWHNVFGWPEHWVALEREELECPLTADGFRPPLEDSSCTQMPKAHFLSVLAGCGA